MPPSAAAAKLPLAVRGVVVACFFGTGAAGLIYEILWSRVLAVLMGNTSYSVATLLTVFMGGLALGAWLGGRWAPAGRRGLCTYGILELSIGVYCFVLPWLFEAAEPLFSAIYRDHYESLVVFNLSQLAVVGVLLIVPTTLMGATLPIVVEFLVTRLGMLSGTVGRLYAVNSGGAFAGAMMAGLVFLPSIGIRDSYSIAVTINIGVGLIAIALSWRVRDRPAEGGSGTATPFSPKTPEPSSVERPAPVFSPWILLVGFGVCGFAAMVYQVAWTRAVTVAIGSSTYAFTLIAGSFIFGLTLGSTVLGWMGDRRWGRYVVAALPIIIGLAAVVTVVRLGDLPIRVTRMLTESDSFGELEWAKFRAIFFLFLVPTFCMGGLLPLVCRSIAQRRDEAARSVGNAYAANAVGTILGSFAGGFVLIPTIGMRASILVGAALSVTVGCVFLYQAMDVRRALRVGVPTFALLVCGVAILGAPKWDAAVITSGPYVNSSRFATSDADSLDAIRDRMQEQKILYYREGVSTLVTVTESARGLRSLVVGGKPDAHRFASTQNWLGHLPMFLRPTAKDILVIGLGSGHTLGSVQCHPNVESVDCVEISAEVAHAAREYFGEYTDDALEDPRSRLIIADGRLHLEHTDRDYDVIISQPSNPWIAGASAMFTRECFDAMRRRLRPGGLACIWVQGFNMPLESFRSLVRTWTESWPHTSIWTSRIKGEHLLVGSGVALEIDFASLEREMAHPRVAIQMKQFLRMPTPAHVLGYLVAADESVRAIGGDATPNTDDNGRIEFDTPRGMRRDHALEILRELNEHRMDPWGFVVRGQADAERFRAARTLSAQILADQREILESLNRPEEEREWILRRILQRNPCDATAARFRRRAR